MRTLLLFALLGVGCGMCAANELPDSPVPKSIVTRPTPQHRYWNRETRVTIGVEGAAMAADLAYSCHNVANGGRELWLPVKDCKSIVAFQLGVHAGANLLSWGFHKAGWHKLERVPRIWMIVANTRGAAYTARHAM